MKLAHLLGFVTQNILLSVLFFLILFPVSLISKLFIKDPLMLSDNKGSYFTDITKEADKESFEKPW
jgi:ABC-type microcin C transport system permease subunit YejE